MAWRDVAYSAHRASDPRQCALLDVLRREYAGGGAELWIFDAVDPAAYREALRSDLPGSRGILAEFFRAPSVRAALPELELDDASFDAAQLVSISSYGFEGELTALLLDGGAYTRDSIGEEEARRLSRSFVDSIVEGARRQVPVWCIVGAWTAWHCDVAWDVTFVLQVPHRSRWMLLIATDTD